MADNHTKHQPQTAIMRFIKTWSLAISILTGIASYYIYVSIPALNPTHAAVGTAINYLQPMLIGSMLFVSFCRMSIRELKPQPWMMKLLAIQSIGFVLPAALIIACPDIPYRAVIESGMICMICPTATAAAVVTTRLHGNANTVVSYTCLINLLVSFLIPAIVPFLHENAIAQQGFETSFLLIIGKVFPLLMLPLLVAWIIKHVMPRLHAAILRMPNLAFNLWLVSLALAIAVSVKAIEHSDESLTTILLIALVSLICCLLQFILGHTIGKKHDETTEGTQALGQKNTAFAIWLGYTFLNPVTAIAGGFYSVWHNVVNTWQLYKQNSEL